jgi:hypothetical protein
MGVDGWLPSHPLTKKHDSPKQHDPDPRQRKDHFTINAKVSARTTAGRTKGNTRLSSTLLAILLLIYTFPFHNSFTSLPL